MVLTNMRTSSQPLKHMITTVFLGLRRVITKMFGKDSKLLGVVKNKSVKFL
jgi:hypothetical protein